MANVTLATEPLHQRGEGNDDKFNGRLLRLHISSYVLKTSLERLAMTILLRTVV